MNLAVQLLFLIATVRGLYVIIENNSYDCADENSDNSTQKSLEGWNPIPIEEVESIAVKCYNSDLKELVKCFQREAGVIDAKGCFLIPRSILQDKVFKEIKYK